ncbi:carbohydrate ABC transporter permease [Streptomyces griseomycini]|uniref:Multiple sugar transport system permease protein n=1 Tax=Streptomyces griseomycini TaxID=66895 RepID=A0A7W7VA82_9ACTN|nr:sugar ABC transporter permease [Streptomyces griseomycini]MBB4902669.1 multiple sugar transport system permease protein [Streptomyces griseomycini]GGQ35168.1 ABC transporter permease [Streptomyces griseomycini]GGR54906.1 ABC transporter permease [Streptomyces griseomycini]
MTAVQKTRASAHAVGRRNAPPPESGTGRPRTGRRRRVAVLTPWLFLAAPLTLLVTFTYLPVADMIGYSFTDWDGVSPTRSYVGAENYTDLVTQPARFEVFLVSGFYLAASVVQIALALYFATVLSFDTRFRNLFKGLLFFPYLINGVAVGFVFLYFFQPDGTLDTLLRLIGVDGKHLWLGDPDLANPSLAGVSVWRFMGLNMVLFLGAIQSIPPHLYEAAQLDGANRWQQFRHIIAPSIKPIISLSFILAVSGSLAVFEIPYIMTGGANGTETFVIQTVKLAFQFDKVGLASASAVVLLILILLITWVQRRLIPEERVELS